MNEKIKNIHNKAIACYKEKKFDQAIQLWQKSLQIDSQEVEVLYSLGIIHFELKKYEESIKYLNDLLELSPGHHKAMLIVGTAYIKLRKFDIAEDFIQKSIDIKPDQKLANLNLGAIYSVQKKFDQGIEMFKKVIDSHPNEVRAHLGLAKIYAILGQIEEANQYFKKVVELNPNGQLGNYAKKAISISDISSKEGKDLDQIYASGYNLLLGGYYKEAIKKFEVYLFNRPKDDWVNFLLAESQMRCGLLKESFKSFKKAILSNSKNGLYYKELAILLDKIGNSKDVISILTKAKELGKEDSTTCFLFGKSLDRKVPEKLNLLKPGVNHPKNSW